MEEGLGKGKLLLFWVRVICFFLLAALLLGYATYIVRSEKFSEGHVAACHARGYLAAILRRLDQLEAAQ